MNYRVWAQSWTFEKILSGQGQRRIWNNHRLFVHIQNACRFAVHEKSEVRSKVNSFQIKVKEKEFGTDRSRAHTPD